MECFHVLVYMVLNQASSCIMMCRFQSELDFLSNFQAFGGKLGSALGFLPFWFWFRVCMHVSSDDCTDCYLESLPCYGGLVPTKCNKKWEGHRLSAICELSGVSSSSSGSSAAAGLLVFLFILPIFSLLGFICLFVLFTAIVCFSTLRWWILQV